MPTTTHRILRLTLGLLLGICAIGNVSAQEKLPVLKAGRDVYTNITVTSVTKTDVYFTYAQGMGNVKLKNLDPEMQRHFHFDAAAAGQVEKQQQKSSSQFFQKTSGILEPLDVKSLPKDPKQRMEAVIDRVKEIVNQPVSPVRPLPDKSVSHYPYWFHEGATKPDFNHVDVRATQKLEYGKADYVVSDRAPNDYYPGPELEFNSMTKYFYTDRSVPKKKLTQAEMVEINRLYRIIGQCETELAK